MWSQSKLIKLNDERNLKKKLNDENIYPSLLHRWHSVMKKVHISRKKEVCSDPGLPLTHPEILVIHLLPKYLLCTY